MNIDVNCVRRQNFSQYEVETLLRMTRKYKSTIENKETNAVTNRLKRATWIAIKNEFNSVPGVSKRNESQLQNLYKNLKRKVVRAKAEGKMQFIPTDGELKEKNECSQDSPERSVSMSSVVLSVKNLCDTDEDPQGLTKYSTCSSDNYSLNSIVENDRVNETNDNEVMSLPDIHLDSTELVTNPSTLKSKKSPAPCFMNFEESFIRKKTKRKNSTDESSSDAGLPSSSKQRVTCSRPSVSCASEDMTMQRQVRRETYGKDSPDSAFCHYIHTMLTTIPDCFEKEMAKIRMTEILMKLKYPQG